MGFEYDWIVLISIGIFAGALNTIAGGGSLLTLPFLIFLGLPPSIANGTNRIAILLLMKNRRAIIIINYNNNNTKKV